MYSCHQDLSPRSLLDACKGTLRANGVRIPDKKDKGYANAMREERKVPEHRLLVRLGLEPFDIAAPMMPYQDQFKSVKMMLRQNIGAPCVAGVKVGEVVTEGQKIAAPPEGALGACLHASISGKVTAVSDSYIMIQAE